MLCQKHDKRLDYFSRGTNYIRSYSAELCIAQRSADESERSRIVEKLKELEHVREGLERDPAGVWRTMSFTFSKAFAGQ